ncbi:MAG: cation transporter [Anaerolineae bacterium]|uniref:monovalent cation/H+ antiporter complex subunit F n=1 Tax=Candidatus Flexifilum breve TaxID=3140694 RepID=UPI001AC0A550|nr:cation transporter [Chloroflexota bacterium]MBK9745654.1 cation transporter [Chloroflexota bacterium]MBN8635688.1 cation transporter [Anaerolineae bacterium]
MNTMLFLVELLLLFSLVLVSIRLLRGPTLADRAVASDQLALRVVALIAVHSMVSDQSFLIDLVIVTAIVGFLSMAVIGIYIERIVRRKRGEEIGDIL